ncbi:MAG: DNA cytosine methyltransferase [Caulobacterales bacterium]|nr:DNA cytosine methyltransferase [Caulobacterales bacterium]
MPPGQPTVLEFFAGSGMARLGLAGWRTSFANDSDGLKAAAYRENFGEDVLRVADVWDLVAGDLPAGRADLAWASSPCQDLSLAGARRGLGAERSGAFWGFWRLVEALDAEGRAPRLIVIENVTGLLSSNHGQDFRILTDLLASQGWIFGALEIDAAFWLPQSRPRLFLVATRQPAADHADRPGVFHSRAIVEAEAALSGRARAAWRWWQLPAPPARNTHLAALLEPDTAVDWLDAARTEALIHQMAPLHRRRIDAAVLSGRRTVGTAFRRVRQENGGKVQRAEVRFDGVAGCLRTPAGGSSRQYVLVVEDGNLHARFLTPREAMRLMGVGDDYRLPGSRTAGLKLAGDGVAVPVVRALSEGLLTPLLRSPAIEAA